MEARAWYASSPATFPVRHRRRPVSQCDGCGCSSTSRSSPIGTKRLQSLPWKVTDAPTEFFERIIERIVGIEIPIAKLAGKWNVSQNRSDSDKLGVVAGLLAQAEPGCKEMAVLVNKYLSSWAAEDPR
jgi:hypothetical protein